MSHLVAGGVAALACLLAGLLVPALVARLPEPPAPDPTEAEDPVLASEGPKELYTDVAALPGLALRSAVVSAVAGGAVGLTLGWSWDLVIVLVLVPTGVALAVVDHRTRLLPSVVVLPLTWVVMALVLVAWGVEHDTAALERAAIGLVVARSFYWLLWRIRSAGMGFGDVRLAAPLGCALGHVGWSELVVGLYAGFLVFGLPGLLLAIVRRDRALLRTAFAFGPFMLLGALIGVLAGEPLLAGLVGGSG